MKPRIGVAGNAETFRYYVPADQVERLRQFGEVELQEYDLTADSSDGARADDERRFRSFVAELDILILREGCPPVTQEVLASAPRLRMIGEIEGDRRTGQIDGRAARAAGVLVVDTTHAASGPVAEWALALSLLGLREHGRFPDIMSGQKMSYADYKVKPPARELTGRRVGMIGFGHIAWRLCRLLTPFDVTVLAYDPYAPRELADALEVTFATLDDIMTCEVVVCMAPATPATTGMIGERELSLLRPDAVFVNVGRGVVVDGDALARKARQNDAWFGIDVHDPEPISVDSPLIGLRNVFLSPHTAGNTAEVFPRYFTYMVDEVERLLAGHEPRARITDRVTAGRS